MKIIDHAKLLKTLSKDNNIALTQSFYLNGGLNFKSFDNTKKVETIMNKTLTHLNISNLNEEKWTARFNEKDN